MCGGLDHCLSTHLATTHLRRARCLVLPQLRAGLVRQWQLIRLASPLRPRRAAAWESRPVARALQAGTCLSGPESLFVASTCGM